MMLSHNPSLILLLIPLLISFDVSTVLQG